MSNAKDIPDEGKADSVESQDINKLGQINLSEKTPVKKGDVLITSVPFAYVLKASLRGFHCDNCLRKKQGAQRCSSCASAYYCNIECQRNSWEIHKKECSKLKKLKTNTPPDTARLMARVIYRINAGGYDVEEKVNDVRTRKFKDLMNHYEDVKEDPTRQEHFTSLLVVLKKIVGEENLPSTDELLGIYGRVLVNCFTITDKDLNGVGLGVYLSASVIDHSCKPNAYASFVGTTIAVRSLYDMADLDWSEIRISYIDVLDDRERRRAALREGYFFECDCAHCRDREREKVMSSIACGNKDCSFPVYVDETADMDSPVGPCERCGFSDFDKDTREKYVEIVNLTRTKLDQIKDKNFFDASCSLLEKQTPLLHRLNLCRVKVLDAAFESGIDVSSCEAAVEYGTQNLEGLKFYYGSNHPMYGLCLLKLGRIELYLFRLQEALGHLEEAEPVLRVSHGPSHPLVCDDLYPLLKQARQEIKMMVSSGFDVKKKAHQKDILA